MIKVVVSLLVTLSLMRMALPVRADWIADSNQNSMEVLQLLGEYRPEILTFLGVDEFDSEVLDLAPKLHQRRQASARAMLQKLQPRAEKEGDPRVRQDLEILVQAVEDNITSNDIERKYLLPYYNLHKDLFTWFGLLLDARSDTERYGNALVRLRKYNGREPGYEPVAQLAAARSSERFGEQGLLGPYVEELKTEIDNAPRYIQGLRDLFERSGLEGWQEDFSLLEQQLQTYLQWQRKELLPRARQSNLLPPAVYANNLKNYGVYATPEELISKAQYSYQLIRNEMKTLARKIAIDRNFEERELVPVMQRLKREQIPQGQLLALYQERLAAIEDIIRREDIITLPKRQANIRLATEAEAAAVPASFMRPPQLINNTGQYGEFVLVQSNPALKGDEAQMDDWSHDAITWALTVHEARPGHELQYATLVENGTSLARAIFAGNSANSEGWGLYAESIMQQYLPPEGQLFNLFTRLMRAARMFLDPMVNTGQMTPQEARDFLVEQAGVSLPMAVSESDRYAFWMPGQATSYYYGYMSLMRLRTEVEIALGSEFNQRQFHDFILEQGLLPPDLLREAVLDEFVR